MATEGLIFICIALSVGVGFLLGRWNPFPIKSKSAHPPSRYLEGLTFLLHEQQDAAIDSFVAGLDVEPDTLETHFALGALWRKKGEFTRAIQVHRNILSSQKLKPEHYQHAQLELALDFARSGLLDRAEILLKEIAESSTTKMQCTALKELVYLYQEEREWEKAIEIINILSQRKFKIEVSFWRHLQAHYCCEMADSFLKMNPSEMDGLSRHISGSERYEQAGTLWVNRALDIKSNHARALTMRCMLELEKNDIENARRTLKAIAHDSRYSMIVVPLMLRCFSHASESDELFFYLADLYQDSAQLGLIPLLADRVYLKSGDVSALEFVIQELSGREKLSAIAEILEVSKPNCYTYADIKPVIYRALPFVYSCQNCGFQGHQFYWCCPSCKAWL